MAETDGREGSAEERLLQTAIRERDFDSIEDLLHEHNYLLGGLANGTASAVLWAVRYAKHDLLEWLLENFDVDPNEPVSTPPVCAAIRLQKWGHACSLLCLEEIDLHAPFGSTGRTVLETLFLTTSANFGDIIDVMIWRGRDLRRDNVVKLLDDLRTLHLKERDEEKVLALQDEEIRASFKGILSDMPEGANHANFFIGVGAEIREIRRKMVVLLLETWLAEGPEKTSFHLRLDSGSAHNILDIQAHAACWFAAIVFYCDGYFTTIAEFEVPPNQDDEYDEYCRKEIAQFLRIACRLPMDLQQILANRAEKLTADFVPGSDVNLALRFGPPLCPRLSFHVG